MTAQATPVIPLDHFRRGDAVARIFGNLTGRTAGSAHVWLQKDYNSQVALAIRAHNQAEAWARRESWAAAIVAELHHAPDRALDWDLILEHHELDQQDDGWRVNYVNYQTTDARRQWCRALSRFHAVNLCVMRALKAGDR
jgi:hypothetical protein